MIHKFVMQWPEYNLDVVTHLKEVKGDAMVFDFIIDGLDLTNWGVRAEVYDLNTAIRLANHVAGGSAPEILMLDDVSAAGHFQIHVATGATSTFQQFGQIEVELTDPDGNKFTIFQQEIWFANERVFWNRI